MDNQLNQEVCRCGCGEPLDPSSRFQRTFKHIPGHQRIGKTFKHRKPVSAKTRRKMRKAWTPARRKAQAEKARTLMAGRYGPEHSVWKGGHSQTSHGYVLVTLPPNHPLIQMARWTGSSYIVYQHRLV